jgi:DNA mismatch repair protein MutS2
MHSYPKDIHQVLDFEIIWQQVLQHTCGTLGIKYLQNLNPIIDTKELEVTLKTVGECKNILQYDEMLPHEGFDDFNFLPILKVENDYFSVEQLCILYKNLLAVKKCLQYFQHKKRLSMYPYLQALFSDIYFDNNWLQKLEKIVDIEKRVMRPDASPELKNIAESILDKEQKLQQVFKKIIQKYRDTSVLHDHEESIRSGRRVLAVKAEHKRSIQGIFLDESSGGNITYIEPEETVHINNHISELQAQYLKEQIRILKNITQYFRPYSQHLLAYQNILGQLDGIRSKAYLALQIHAIVPEVNDKHEIKLINFRHPVLQLNAEKNKKDVIANSVHLHENQRIMVISGPNAGGKSIVLKSIGLFQLMLSYGLLLPCDEGSAVSLFQSIFVDMGDKQDIYNDLSTYSAHLHAMQYFLKNCDKNTLFLADEMGDGTDPLLGGAVAEAILDELYDKQSYGIVTTHYANLKVWAGNHASAFNASMTFDHKNLSPTYNLQTGIPGSSFTFEIAKKNGLSPQILKAATDKLTDQNKALEISITAIQNEKQYIKGLRKNLQQREQQVAELQAHYELLKQNLEKEKKQLVKSYKEKSLEDYNTMSRDLENKMREWKENKDDKNKFLSLRKHIDENRNSLENEIDENNKNFTPEPIQVHDNVRIKDGNEIGIVMEIRKDSALVSFGAILTLVKLTNLSLSPTSTGKNKHTSANHKSKKLLEKAAFNIELDIRGLNKEEAFKALDNFMDKAVLYNVGQVKIIHGKGTGVLRNLVHHYLNKYPHAKKFSTESNINASEGITLVEIS